MKKIFKNSLLVLVALCITLCSASVLTTNNVDAASKAGKTKTYSRTITYHKQKFAANPVFIKYTIKQNTKTHAIISKSVKCINPDKIKQSLKITANGKTNSFTITGSVTIPGKGMEFGAGNAHEGISCVGVKAYGNFKTGSWDYKK